MANIDATKARLSYTRFRLALVLMAIGAVLVWLLWNADRVNGGMLIGAGILVLLLAFAAVLLSAHHNRLLRDLE